MEDKKTLGKFIQTKRKENNLSQKELAAKLYVTESAVSKWERGISYPDITMISGICSALNISEHELCTASEDYQQRETELMAKSYKRFVKGYTVITGACYLAAIIPSFIYNFISNKTAGWFFILLTSLMMTFSVVNVPVLVRKHTALAVFGSFYISLDLLLAAGCLYSGGDWFLMAFLGILLAVCIVFLPFILRSDIFEKYVRGNKGLICFTADTFALFAVIAYGTWKYGSASAMKSGLITAAVLCSLCWIWFAVIRYLKVSGFFKAAVCIASAGVYMIAADIVLNAVDAKNQIVFMQFNGKDRSVLACVIIMSAAAVLSVVGAVLKFVKKKEQ